MDIFRIPERLIPGRAQDLPKGDRRGFWLTPSREGRSDPLAALRGKRMIGDTPTP
jgi:hypothetical protein